MPKFGRRVVIETVGAYRGGRPAATVGKPPRTPSGSVQPRPAADEQAQPQDQAEAS